MWYLEEAPNMGVLGMNLIKEDGLTSAPTMAALPTYNGIETDQILAAHRTTFLYLFFTDKLFG